MIMLSMVVNIKDLRKSVRGKHWRATSNPSQLESVCRPTGITTQTASGTAILFCHHDSHGEAVIYRLKRCLQFHLVYAGDFSADAEVGPIPCTNGVATELMDRTRP